ncbi:MAG: AMP-binding protein [Sphingobium sp.]
MSASYFLKAEDCVVRDVLDRRAREHPDRDCVQFDDGDCWSYAELRAQVRRHAAAFEALGVAQGDFVLTWLPNGKTGFVVTFALNYLGAVYVPINTAYRGALLDHVIENSGARLMIVDERFMDRLPPLPAGLLERVVHVGDGTGGQAPAGAVSLEEALAGAGEPGEPVRPIQPWDIQAVIYTSGTTGPSKGVLIPYAQVHETFLSNQPDHMKGRLLLTLPLFHMAGAGVSWACVMAGGTVVLVPSFKTDAFWDLVDRFGVTHTILLGAMTPFLLKAPPSPADRSHTLRTVNMVPLSAESGAFAERFGVEIWTAFNMTEISTPVHSTANPQKPGTCGRVRPGVEVRLVDENDCEVPVGEVGEMIVRADHPWVMNAGYNRNPEATAKAWRNGWFHTGDVFRQDADGDFYFVDRQKDALRRRGENISSWEVERELNSHPAVRESAVIGVPSEYGEDDVMAVIEPVEGHAVDEVDIITFMRERVAHFMVPRYVRFVPSLPRTPTEKVEKHRLRAEGVTPDCWDREANNIVVKSEQLA